MSTGNLSRDEAQRRAALISGVRYRITLDLSDDPTATAFDSITDIEFTAGATGDTFLDLNAESVTSVELNGTAVAAVTDSESRLALPGVVAGANHVVVHARCAYQHTGVGMHRVIDPVDGLVYLYTHFEPFDAHAVFACFDQPDLKAPFDITVTAPAAWRIISNGAHGNSEAASDGRTRHTFTTTEPISTYLMAVVAGPYHEATSEHRGVALGLYCRSSLGEHLDTEELFEITRQGLDFFGEYFQIPYPFGKYDQLFVPEFNMGAMENPGCVTFNDAYVFRSKVTDSARSRRANTILHEMAHMWFGDLVTMRWWDDLWLNESFATYMAHLSLDRATRFDDSWVDLATTMKSWAMRQDQLPTTHPIAADMADTDAVRLNFDGITYAKGASVLRQLVAWVGDDAFRDGLRDYMQTNKWNNATLADFLGALERSSGRDLGAWSREWLQRAGVNSLRPEIETADGVITRFTIVQSAPADHSTVRSHHIGIGLFDESGDRLVRRSHIEVDIAGERSEVAELVGVKTAPLVLLNDGDLSYSKVRLDPTSTATMLVTTGRIDDPLARAICWAGLWDMTRDGEMATRDYVRIFTHQAALEQELSTLERFIAQVLLAVDVYGDPRNRTAARSDIRAAAVIAFNAAEAGSDVQLTWARCMISSSHTDAELSEIAGWLQRKEVAGLRIDTDVRWAIVTRLAAAGRANAADIESEAELDPSDSGRRRAVTALTARPTAEAKAEGWRLALEDDNTPLQIRAAAMMGFHQAGQDELITPYIERYGRSLSGLWSRLRPEEAVDIAEGLFPRLQQGDDVLAMADAAMDDTSLPPEARRIIAEQRSAVLRARRAREVDIAAAEGAPV